MLPSSTYITNAVEVLRNELKHIKMMYMIVVTYSYQIVTEINIYKKIKYEKNKTKLEKGKVKNNSFLLRDAGGTFSAVTVEFSIYINCRIQYIYKLFG